MAAIRFLLEHGAHPDAGLSFPPMINALAHGNDELVQLLLKFGATPGGMGQAINPSGNTPLHSICSERDVSQKSHVLERVRALLAAGADVNALTTAGYTPLDVALEPKGDDSKAVGEGNDAEPLNKELIALLKEHGALRGCQLRMPRPRFCGRVLIDGALPEADQLRNLCLGESGAVVQPVNHAWMGEGLGALVGEAAMSDDEMRAALAHTCYIEITLEEPGAVPMELALRYVKLLCSVATHSCCVGIDFGRTVIAPQYAFHLTEHPELILPVLVQGKLQDLGLGCESVVTEGMADFGYLEVVYTDSQPAMATGIVQSVILPMLLTYSICLEHNHRAFVAPDFSLVAKIEPLGPDGSPVLSIRPDRERYCD